MWRLLFIMKNLRSSKNKIQEICDLLKRDTLEPAREEASRLLQEAEEKAKEIVDLAKKQSKDLLEKARVNAKQEEDIFHGNLKQAAKQSLEALRQSIEKELFHTELTLSTQKALNEDLVLPKLIEALVRAVDKEGLSASLEVQVSKACDAKKLASQVSKDIMDKLGTGDIKLGTFGGGVKVKLKEKNITLDFTDDALLEVLVSYVRKDFRKLFFN